MMDGDFNARVGKRNAQNTNIVGIPKEDGRNNNKQGLKEYYISNALTFANISEKTEINNR